MFHFPLIGASAGKPRKEPCGDPDRYPSREGPRYPAREPAREPSREEAFFFAAASAFAIPSLRRPCLSVRPSVAVSTFAGWAFAVPVLSLPFFDGGSLATTGLTPGGLATGLAATLGGAPLSGWVLAATGFGAAAGFAPTLAAVLAGSAFFESFFSSALAGCGLAAGLFFAPAFACWALAVGLLGVLPFAACAVFALFFRSVFRAF